MSATLKMFANLIILNMANLTSNYTQYLAAQNAAYGHLPVSG